MSNRDVDVTVVGAGIIGTCTALELVRAGCSVRLLDAGGSRPWASSGNAGMLVPSHVIPLSAPGVVAQGLRWMMRRDAPFHLKLRPNIDLLRWLWTFWRHATHEHVARAAPVLHGLSQASMLGFADLAEELDDFDYAPTGLLMVHATDRMREDLWHEADLAEQVGLKVQRLNEAGLQELEPNLRSPATGAIFFEGDGRVDPDRLMRLLLQKLRDLGVDVQRGVHVTDVDTGRLRTAEQDYHSPEIVIATGAWTPDLTRRTGVRVPIQAAKGYSITVPAPEAAPTIPTILMEQRVTMTPMSGRLRFAGTLSLSGLDARVDPRRVRPIQNEVRRYRPDMENRDLPATWTGFRPASPDGLPLMGRIGPGLWVATGHGMMGTSLGPASGRLMADLILGRPPVVSADPFDPARFS